MVKKIGADILFCNVKKINHKVSESNNGWKIVFKCNLTEPNIHKQIHLHGQIYLKTLYFVILGFKHNSFYKYAIVNTTFSDHI